MCMCCVVHVRSMYVSWCACMWWWWWWRYCYRPPSPTAATHHHPSLCSLTDDNNADHRYLPLLRQRATADHGCHDMLFVSPTKVHCNSCLSSCSSPHFHVPRARCGVSSHKECSRYQTCGRPQSEPHLLVDCYDHDVIDNGCP